MFCISDSTWLTNQSFIADELKILTVEPTEPIEIDVVEDENSSKEPKSKKRKKEKKRSRKKSPIIEFTGKEDYYVDKKSFKGYFKVDTIHRPARPKYNYGKRILGSSLSPSLDGKHILGSSFGFNYLNKKSRKRYFEEKSLKKRENPNNDNKIIDETEYVLKVKEFNEYLNENPYDINKWLEFVNHQQRNNLKLSNTQIAEKKMEIIERGLKENPKNLILIENYIEIVTKVFPSDDVSKIIEKLLVKDPTNFLLWETLINATQGSMARCIVPDVLKLYEKCMQTLYNKLGDDVITMSKLLFI